MNDTPKPKFLNTDLLSKYMFSSENIVNPKRDWTILIFLFVIFIISSISYDFYMYRKIISGDMYISVKREDLEIENLKHEDLRKILETLESKRTKINNLELKNLIDPSL